MQTENLPPQHHRFEEVNEIFERSLVFMHRMPSIWKNYTDFLTKQCLLTRTRRTFDRALQALPVTQHHLIWPGYIEFAKRSNVRELCVRVLRRYLQFQPEDRQKYIDYLKNEAGHWDEAAVQLAIMIDDPKLASLSGKSAHALWIELCNIVSQYPREIYSLPIEAVLRSGINRFSDEIGRLWCALAEYHIRIGMFERARDVYEEAIASVQTVRDFATVFDAYVQFEEALLTAKLESIDSEAPRDTSSMANTLIVKNDSDLEDLSSLEGAADDTELRLERLELLMDRRPLLLSSVLLRQNPHNVHEWHNRARIYKSQEKFDKVIATYAEAVKIVDPKKATGQTASLWKAFAKVYEDNGDPVNARLVFAQAIVSDFKKVDDLASVWCSWAEMEIRQKKHKNALIIIAHAAKNYSQVARSKFGSSSFVLEDGMTVDLSSVVYTKDPGVFSQLYQSKKVWSLYLDLQESMGSVADVRSAYNEAIDQHIATPLMVLNYASYLEEKKHFEDSFKAYERGVAVFEWPHVREIWHAYLKKFVERYGGSKIERTRDLFEYALSKCPPNESAPIFSMYAEMEEKYGLIRNAMSIYERAVNTVDPGEQYLMFLKYIRKTEEFFGTPRTREIYEKAIKLLPDIQVPDMCLRFADVETKLGELERAHRIFAHAAHFCNPDKNPLFWEKWQTWIVTYGNEESFKDMLRVKRAVIAKSEVATSGLEKLLDPSQSNASESADMNTASGATMAGQKRRLAPVEELRENSNTGATERGALERFRNVA